MGIQATYDAEKIYWAWRVFYYSQNRDIGHTPLNPVPSPPGVTVTAVTAPPTEEKKKSMPRRCISDRMRETTIFTRFQGYPNARNDSINKVFHHPDARNDNIYKVLGYSDAQNDNVYKVFATPMCEMIVFTRFFATPRCETTIFTRFWQLRCAKFQYLQKS